MLYNLDWPRYMYGSGTYISRRDKKLVCRYLGTETGEYKELERYQLRVREQQLTARHKKKTDVWDEVMKQVPGIPKNWERWLLKNVNWRKIFAGIRELYPEDYGLLRQGGEILGFTLDNEPVYYICSINT